ncbi:MAG: betC [Paenibacillaceae bacterium]|jgi:arylsulfatase A-like enzyme|nr:betC [Paenibacillaceae bacterium]
MTQTNRKPNVVFITTDHQRADSLGMVQCGREVTPHLNRLAQRSHVFTRAYDTCPLCVPARTAMATGIYPTRNGVLLNRGQTASDFKTMHQYLAQAGYRMAHLGKNHIRTEPDLKRSIDFDLWSGEEEYSRFYRSIRKSQPRKADQPNETNLYKRAVSEYQNGAYVDTQYSSAHTGLWDDEPAEHHYDLYNCRLAAEFVRANSPERTETPFALFLNIWAPHPPLQVPAAFASLFPPQEIELPPNVGAIAQGEPPGRRRGVPAQLAEGLSMEQWRDTWSAHLGLLHMADSGIGLVLQALEETGATDHTILIFTSDHGDHLGQHIMYQKMEMYEQAIHVPLIIHLPMKNDPVTIDDPVSHLDLLPTMLELVDVPVPADLDGVSLRPVLADPAVSDPNRIVHSQYSGNPAIGDIRRAVVAKRYKYIFAPDGQCELYDLAEDPLEMNNVVDDPGRATVRDQLHEQAKAWAQGHGDWIEFT